MDTWYATKKVMLLIESFGKHYYCPLKNNRQVDESAGVNSYQRVDGLEWNDEELSQGKTIKIICLRCRRPKSCGQTES
jgi:hypothetical protein